jgi:orotidine-5'-phosphate decarboxylase
VSIDILIEKIKQKNNPTVAGLDPVLDYIPRHIIEESFKNYGKNLTGATEAIHTFNCALIDALCDIVPAVKPQSAYYEMYGWRGVCVLERTIKYAKSKGLYVIADVKRNDIGSTAAAYASAYLGETNVDGERFTTFDADGATINAYLGEDGIKPFIELCEKNNKSIFVLVKTSNPSSSEFQDKKAGNDTVYGIMADMVSSWGKSTIGKYNYSSVGAVVGATYPKHLIRLRERMPETFFLVPGYGAQGGGAADIAGAFDKDGLGAVVNSSRAIMCAYKKSNESENFALAARREAIRMRDEIMSVIG